MKTFLCTMLFLATLSAFSQNIKEADLIRKARQSSNEAIAKRDIDGIAKYWLDDFLIIRGGGVIVIGKEASKADWIQGFKETPEAYYERIPSEIIISQSNPDMAWETGNWKGFNTYSKGGRYSAQWKKKEGAWKLQAELFVALKK